MFRLIFYNIQKIETKIVQLEIEQSLDFIHYSLHVVHNVNTSNIKCGAGSFIPPSAEPSGAKMHLLHPQPSRRV
jgi:hypothetical protein